MYDALVQWYFAVTPVVWFVTRLLLHIGIVVSVWRFKSEQSRYRVHVNFVAIALCGTQAVIILTAFRDLHSKGFDMFNPAITACVAFLYLGIIANRGNVAFMAKPLEKLYYHIRTYVNVK